MRDDAKPVVFFLPGILGSTLVIDGIAVYDMPARAAKMLTCLASCKLGNHAEGACSAFQGKQAL